MKIAVYDKWLDALGGGEKVATVMAETLSKAGHSVELVSNSDIKSSEIENKMGVDLSKVKLVFWSERSYEMLSPLTKKYDLFINVSFLDHLPSKAKKSIYYILFPSPIKKNLLGFIKYETILPFLRKFLIIPEIKRGLKDIDEIIVRSGKWLSKENTLVLVNSPKRFDIYFRIYSEQLTLRSLKSVSLTSDSNSNIEIVDKYIDHRNNVLTYKLNVDMINKQNLVLKIHNKQDPLKNSLGLVSMTVMHPRYFAWNVIKRFLPTYEMALYGSSNYKPAAGLDTYGLFLADSKFTKKWTTKYWEKDSKVLYPPIDIEEFEPAKKKNIILNVGRFFVGGHSKRQDILVEVFKDMVDNKNAKDWELHLVGGVASGNKHQKYLQEIQESVRDYPVYFHLFANFKELKKLYSQAKIYWHATGYGVDINKNPIELEHFGITPVEAMAAGCVPVVYKEGGPVESIGKESGLTWGSKQELSDITRDLIENPRKLSSLSKKYQKRAGKFSRKQFKDKLISYIKKL